MERTKYCVIMAGGIGSRFWPISRIPRPKQFLDILGTGKTFIRGTFERFRPIVADENFLVVTNSIYKDLVMEELPELRQEQVLCEPIGRNTAPCIAYAAFRLNAMDPNADMIVTPSDHMIFNPKQFEKAINESVDFIRSSNTLMTIGIKPSHPNTGYGYIQVDGNCGENSNICNVKTFTEKPNLELATAFVDSGEFFWNSGIFIWRVDTILEALEVHLPDLYTLFNSIRTHYNTPQEQQHIKKIYPECRKISIDFGVMERASDVSVYCADFGWSDIGTWGSLYEYSDKDERGNVVSQNSSLYNTNSCIVKVPEHKLVVIEGLKDYIVVDSGDVLMICPKANEQNITKYIQEVKFKKGDRFA